LGRGSRGGSGTILEDRIFRGGGKRIIIILEDDTDSDRPAWAGGNTELNPHIRGSQGAYSGVKRGDLYGDLWIIARDLNGEPVLYVWTDSDGDGVNDTAVQSDAGYIQPLDANGNPIPLDNEGELYTNADGSYVVDPIEVAFDRLNIARTTAAVFDHALTTAIDKLDAATTVTLDEAGRLVVDGATIDSPLENLALYSAYMTNATLPNLPANFDPSALLAAAASKTGEITVDTVVYLNTIVGVNQRLTDGSTIYYDFSDYDYSRVTDYAGETVTYYKDTDGDPSTLEQVTEPLLTAVFADQDWTDPTAVGGVDDFAQAADDARAVIEFLHSVPLVPTTTG
jgi:hypothetical protein